MKTQQQIQENLDLFQQVVVMWRENIAAGEGFALRAQTNDRGHREYTLEFRRDPAPAESAAK